MIHIDEKFKDNSPQKTVENITKILDSLNINVVERVDPSDVDHCFSMRVTTTDSTCGSNGKAVTRELARASAYGEFIERLQTGLHFYKYQSLTANKDMCLHAFAPDAKYMTKAELIENGEWMDHIIDSYGNLTREDIAEQCIIFAESENVLTVPYYSLFEDKYVYLPVAFVENIYATNGCCAGNTREEAWIHAMSEIMERHACTKVLTNGEAVPAVPEEILKQYDSVYSTIEKLRSAGFDVSVLDFSDGLDFPVLASRIVNKKTGGYVVDVGADPVFEIAIKRTFTEAFQGRTIENFTNMEVSQILNNVKEVNLKSNLLNQLEVIKGKFTINFFSEETNRTRDFKPFTDKSQKTNIELLCDMLKMFKSFGKPLYIRNHSFLGFPSYFIVVPGFSEARAERITEPLLDYYFFAKEAKALKYIEKATDEMLEDVLLSHRMNIGIYSRERSFPFRAGIPFKPGYLSLMYLHVAYAAYRLNRTKELCTYISLAAKSSNKPENADYVNLLARYFNLKSSNVPDAQIMVLLKRLHPAEAYDRFESALNNNNLFDGLLVRCDMQNCEGCACRNTCRLIEAKELIRRAGNELAKFTNGQARENFKLDFEI